MPQFEVSVRTYRHLLVEADTQEEAEKEAKKQSGFDSPEVYQCYEVDDG